MTSTTERPVIATTHHEGQTTRPATSEMWGAFAIASIWMAVLFASIYGNDVVSVNGAGTNSTTIPSGLVVAFFAFLATVAVAKRAFRRESGPITS